MRQCIDVLLTCKFDIESTISPNYIISTSMQSIFWKGRGLQPLHVNSLFKHSQTVGLLGSRTFATRQPGFSASRPPSAKPGSSKDRPGPFDGSKPSSEPHNSANGPKTEEEYDFDFSGAPLWFRIYRHISPLRVIVVSITAFVAYELYYWQTNPSRSLILNPRNFTPFILEKRDKVSSTSCILNLKSVPAGQNTENVTGAWKTGVWSVLVIQPELQIARAYTPLPPREGDAPEQLRLFVRQEPNGEVSTFLSTIYRGTLVHCRGPHIEYEIPTDVDEVLFIAGGTGIAAALQVAHTLFKYRTALPNHSPKLRILWANRRREDSYQGPLESSFTQQIQEKGNAWFGKPTSKPGNPQENPSGNDPQPQTPLVEELETLKSQNPDQLEINYFVDEEDTYVTESVIRRYLSSSSSNEQQSDPDQPARKKKIILIAGPDGFVSYYAGPKYFRKGVEVQGPLDGLLRKIAPKGWEVWKL